MCDSSPQPKGLPRDVADAVPILIWTTNAQGQSEWFNRGWLEFTGQTLESALADGRGSVAHPEDREAVVSAFESAIDLRDSIEFEYRLRHHDGSYHWMLDRASPRFSDDGQFDGYVGVCVDITKDYMYRSRLQERDAVMQVLHDISERERSFLSCSIHDGLLQDIIGADMLIQGAAELGPEKLAKRLQQAGETLRSAIGHGRRLISELRPMILDEQGLVHAVEFYAAEIENRSGVSFQIDRGNCPEIICPFWGGNVFRVVQEAMNNVESHSKAKKATIQLACVDEQLHISIQDDGVGFDPEAQGSFGVRGMRERTELFGGAIRFDSSVGNGCSVVLSLPLPDNML